MGSHLRQRHTHHITGLCKGQVCQSKVQLGNLANCLKNVAQKNGCYSKCKDSKQGAAATKSLGVGW
jgi:hypothetical protein